MHTGLVLLWITMNLPHLNLVPTHPNCGRPTTIGVEVKVNVQVSNDFDFNPVIKLMSITSISSTLFQWQNANSMAFYKGDIFVKCF